MPSSLYFYFVNFSLASIASHLIISTTLSRRVYSLYIILARCHTLYARIREDDYNHSNNKLQYTQQLRPNRRARHIQYRFSSVFGLLYVLFVYSKPKHNISYIASYFISKANQTLSRAKISTKISHSFSCFQTCTTGR